VEFVGVDNEELRARRNRLLATVERTSLRKLVQVTIGAKRLLLFNAESDVGQLCPALFAGETKFVKRATSMLDSTFAPDNRLRALVTSWGHILLVTIVAIMLFRIDGIVDEPLGSGNVLRADLANETVRVISKPLIFCQIRSPINRLVTFYAVSDRHFQSKYQRGKKSDS